MVRHSKVTAKRRVPVIKAIALTVAFLMVSVGSGVLAAGLLLPMAQAAYQATDVAMQVFDELPSEMERAPMAGVTTIHAANGEIIGRFFIQNRIEVPLSEISQAMIDAVIAIEDERFFEHNGVDARAVGRALMTNVQGGSLQGASTITMQYVKNRLIDAAYQVGDRDAMEDARRQDLPRKAREMRMAIEIETILTKEEILEGYLNIAQFGRRNIHGVEAAARFFFNTTAAELTVVEAATIAAITNAPSRFDPESRPAEAQRRRNLVLMRMRENGMITPAEYSRYRNIPIEDTLDITPLPRGCQMAGETAFFCDYVYRTLMTNPVFGETQAERENLIYRGGLRVYTTIDMELQEIAQEELERRAPQGNDANIQAALVSVIPGDGAIVTMVQNVPFDNSMSPPDGYTAINFSVGHQLGASGGFQTGSVAKNLVLVEWLRSGRTLLEHVDQTRRMRNTSEFTSCLGLANQQWDPRNAGNFGSGPTTVLRASYWSINTAFADMAMHLDLCDVRDTAWDMGFRPSSTRLGGIIEGRQPTINDIEVLPAMFLGTQSSTPLDVATWHATLAAQGVHCEPYAITRVIDRNGRNLPIPTSTCNPHALEARVANTTTYALRYTLTRGTANRVGGLSGGRPSAGKTGTSQNASQTWFAGYTPQLSTTVWVGSAFGDQRNHNVTLGGQFFSRMGGGVNSAPIWAAFMNRALADEPVIPFPPPDRDLVGVYVPIRPEEPDEGDGGGGEGGGGYAPPPPPPAEGGYGGD